MARNRELDVIVWGATGFTGQLVCSYLARDANAFTSCEIPTSKAAITFGLAGRNPAKLAAVATAAGCAHVPVFIATSDDKASIDAFVSKAKVVLATAGPFVKYSSEVVESCARLGTHYVDINGETAWHRAMIDRHQANAKASGSILIPGCGYDSIPSDIGTFYAVQKMREIVGHATPIQRVRCFQEMQTGGKGGGFSGGSLQTGILGELEPIALADGVDREDPFLLGGRPQGGARSDDADIMVASHYPEVGMWAGPFVMQKVNTRIVRRTTEFMDFGANFVYQEVGVAPNQKEAEKMARPPLPSKVIKMMVEQGKLPKPGSGPPPHVRAKAKFVSTFVCDAEGGERIICTISGGEAGYEETAKMVAEAAIELALNGSGDGNVTGFSTPAAVFGHRLVDRLHGVGIRFAVRSYDATGAASDGARSRL